MKTGALGKMYQDGEIIIRQGDTGDCMYVVQEGRVEVVVNQNHKEVRLALRGAGEFFGEMELFDHEVRMATVRALGGARVLTVDKRNFMRRIHEDPSLAFRLVQTMSHRLRDLSTEVTRLNLQIEENAIHEHLPESHPR
jgi:CRP-like cAMP-binding protein